MMNGCRMRAALQRQRRWVTSVNRHCSVSRKTSRQRQLAALGVESLNNTDENAQKECITVTFQAEEERQGEEPFNELPGTDEVFTLKSRFTSPAEYKQKTWSLFALGEVNEGYHRNIVFYTNGDEGNGVGTLSDDSQKAQEIIDTLKAETLTHTGDAMPVLRMEFSQQNNDDYNSEGAVCVTDKDVERLHLSKVRQYRSKAVSAKNVKLVTLSIITG